MGDPEYYKKLVKASKSKNKSELELYRNISKNVDEILESDLEQDKSLLLKSLIAYIEGKSVNSWYLAIMQIVYAVTIGIFSILPNIANFPKNNSMVLIGILIVADIVLIFVAIYNLDFSRKTVLCVLNDKLNEMSASRNNIDISLEILGNNDNMSNLKCKNKKPKKNKK